jgi:hypothetical protein
MKNLFLTSCYGYQWKNIKNWIISLRLVNTIDDVLVITYTKFDQETVDQLKKYNIKFIHEENNNYKRIVVERFKSYANLLQKVKYKFVCLLDLGDIVFQKNPIFWLEQNLKDKKIVAGSECIKYKDEKWAENDFKQSFGYFFDFIKDKPSYNAGSFAGEKNRIQDLCMNIFSMCVEHKYFAPDQAAFNFLIQTAYKEEVFFADFASGWCCQCGTTLDPTKMEVSPFNFSKYILEPQPKIISDRVLNQNTDEFFIVHQYNRVPILKNNLEK